MATKSSFKPFVVSFGGEGLLLDRDLDRARRWVGREPKVLDGEGLTDQELVNVCETFSEAPRTIIVDNAQALKGDKALRRYIEEKSITDARVVVAAIIRSEKLPEVWSLAISKGKGYERKKLKYKSWDTSEITNWIKLEATGQHVSIDETVAANLLHYVGPDLYRLANEIRKLALFVGQAGKIQKEHIALVTTATTQVDQFMVAESTLAKEAQRALNIFSILYKNSGDDCLIPVVSALMRQVEKALTVRASLDRGVPEDEIAVLIGMKPMAYKNFVAPIARKHDVKSLVRHMGRLCKLDADVKGPARSKRTLVELTMLSIAH
jgi:DNA polymerase III delta subunit